MSSILPFYKIRIDFTNGVPCQILEWRNCVVWKSLLIELNLAWSKKIYFIVLKLIIFGVWRDNPVDKITGSSSRGPWSNSQIPQGSKQFPVTPVLEGLCPSSGLNKSCMNVIHRQMQQNICTYRRILNFKNLQKEDSPKMTVLSWKCRKMWDIENFLMT